VEVGTALLQLGRLADLKMYGTASRDHRDRLIELVATPIDYHTQHVVDEIRQAEPNGLDVVFEGIGGHNYRREVPSLGSSQANEWLESGQASGKIVLLTPELL
jgi:NADPH:quinone reductase-like Zn-dependent oxidoreductase